MSRPRSRLLAAVAILAVFAVVYFLREILGLAFQFGRLYEDHPYYYPAGLLSLLEIALVLAAVLSIRRVGLAGGLREVGLLRPVGRPLLFGLLATLPLWLVFAVSSTLVESLPVLETLYLAALSPLAEEVVYRGFAFGQLRRLAGWGFWPAGVVSAAVFAWGHAEDASSLGEGAGLFLLTGLGGLFFCWLYQRWEYNLWAPFSLHLLMNLAWQVFAVGDSALAGWIPTAMQVTTIAAAALLTVYRRRIPYLRPPRPR